MKLYLKIRETMNWDVVQYWTVNPEKDILEIDISLNKFDNPNPVFQVFENISKTFTFKKGVGLPGRVWANNEPAWIDDIDQDSNFPRIKVASKTGLRSGFAFPVSTDNEVFGVMEIFTTEFVKSNHNIMQLFSSIGSQVGQFSIRKAMEKSMLEAKLSSEKANKAKSQFLSQMSHELRTPLHAILGYGELMEGDIKDPLSLDHKDDVKQILKAGNHLMKLINEVLDLAHIESGKLTVSIESVHISSLMDEIITLIQPMADTYGIQLIDRISENSNLFVQADRTRLKQVLLNLISNGIKYNKKKGTLTLSCQSLVNENLKFDIQDTGQGIPESQQKLLFQPFNRLGAENSKIEGTGIGLTICKQLVELMGGKIYLHSVPGKGTCFSIELPLGKCPQVNIEMAMEKGNHKNTLDENSLNDTSYTILYIEDNPANLDLVTKVLQQRPNIRLLSAPEAVLGLDLANAHQPDLILMDINMPGMDGMTAIKILKEREETKKIPVIALSANAMENDIKKALSLGFCHYITKPFKISAFLKIIDNVIEPKGQS